MKTPVCDSYAVIGNPIAHSQSPFIHACFAEQTGEAIEYVHRLASLDGFVASVRAFIAAGGRGLNVTVPFKLEAHAFASTLSERATAAGAVNTLRFDGSDVFGDNTDGVGLVRDLKTNRRIQVAGARVLLLGAGGAARGVMLPLLECGLSSLTVVNRTARNAEILIRQFAPAAREMGCLLTGGNAQAVAGTGCYDVVINATAGSLDTSLPVCDAAAFGPETFAYDLMYGAQPTVFMQHAAALGARTADGLGMLVEQAAESFYVWRGVYPDSAPVLARLRERLSMSATNG